MVAFPAIPIPTVTEVPTSSDQPRPTEVKVEVNPEPVAPSRAPGDQGKSEEILSREV